jgi:hypothetical protein
VATLISKRSTDNSTIFVIDDGTGRIDAFHWNLPNPALEMATIGEIQRVYHSPLHISTHLPFFFFFFFREGKYVRATGKIKINNNGRRCLQLSHIRMSSDPHELYYHLADVMVTELVLKRGPVSALTLYLHSINDSFVFKPGHVPDTAGTSTAPPTAPVLIVPDGPPAGGSITLPVVPAEDDALPFGEDVMDWEPTPVASNGGRDPTSSFLVVDYGLSSRSLLGYSPSSQRQ